MKTRNVIITAGLLIVTGLFIIPLSGCARYSESCPSNTTVNLFEADTYASNDELPFRFPLDNIFTTISRTGFAAFGKSGSIEEYHAAEDYDRPPGTEVYTMADGIVSYSGSMGGYGWLVIVNHPEANLYSLYGHLSPSRWSIKSGTNIEKGDLIGYLGDPYENGGSIEHPLTPHLHFGVRIGQKGDYPYEGEWRWMAGWIKYCPQDLDWLQPSLVIVNQQIPPNGFVQQATGFWSIWGIEIIFSGFFLIGAMSASILITRRRRPMILVLNYGFLAGATLVSFSREQKIAYVLLAILAIMIVAEAFRFIRRLNHN